MVLVVMVLLGDVAWRWWLDDGVDVGGDASVLCCVLSVMTCYVV